MGLLNFNELSIAVDWSRQRLSPFGHEPNPCPAAIVRPRRDRAEGSCRSGPGGALPHATDYPTRTPVRLSLRTRRDGRGLSRPGARLARMIRTCIRGTGAGSAR
jgi:hypothetical protein